MQALEPFSPKEAILRKRDVGKCEACNHNKELHYRLFCDSCAQRAADRSWVVPALIGAGVVAFAWAGFWIWGTVQGVMGK